MKKLLRPIIGIIFLVVAAYLGFVFYSQSIIKLPPPTAPPAFSVSYLYNFSWVNLLESANIDAEIKKDVKNIKNAGFEGLKVNFYFQQDNLASNKVVNIAAKNGLYPIGQLVGHDAKPKDRAFTAEELVAWEKFVRAQVRQNKDLVYFWEIWNEPAMTELRFRYGTPAEYLELLQRTQKIIREENPGAKIIVTADYTDTEAKAFTTEFLRLGGTDYLDYLSFHPYNAIDPEGKYNLTETIAQEKELAERYNKPLWITEIGTPDSDSNETHQAEQALTLFETAKANKIPLVWFHWSDHRVPAVDGKTGWGLIRPDGSFKPAYESLKAFIGKVNN